MSEKKQNITETDGSTVTLLNYFRELKQPSYHEMEVSDLKDIYGQIDHPICNDITKLLEATDTFLCATTLGYFKKFRDETRLDEDLLKTLNEMADALQQTKRKLDQIHDKEVQRVLADTIEYCMQTVKHRLAELKTVNDRFYDLYLHKKNDLTNLLES